jgi:RNA polymerase sigma-70 factor (ECF subfamily)
MTEQLSDEMLMERVAAGDERAFRLLARRHLQAGLGLARRVSGSAADAEEVVQEALLRVWVHAPRWTPRAAFRTWFYRILVNLCLDRRRRPHWTALAEAGERASSEPAALDRIVEDERHQALAAAVNRLPARQRTAVLLTYFEDLSNAETAAVMGVSVAAVEALLTRAKRSLRAKWAES